MDLVSKKRIFDKRHVFDDEDIDLLQERWPQVTFTNIPLAWVFPLNQFLSRVRYRESIREVGQHFGELTIVGDLDQKTLLDFKVLELKTLLLDWDLHES